MPSSAAPADARGASTRKRILDAAGQLFAEDLNATFRELTEAAGVNIAAIHYHFGSKEALLTELFRERATPIVQGRLAGLAAVPRDAEGRARLEDILTAFLRPAVELAAQPQGRHFARLRARLAFEGNDTTQAILAEIYDASNMLFVKELEHALPELPRREVFWRFHFMLGAMQYTMANPGRIRHLSKGQVDPSAVGLALPRLVAFAAAGFRDQAPPPSRHSTARHARRPGPARSH